MSPVIHKLITKNPDTGTGECQRCGSVTLRWKYGKGGGWRCGNSLKQYAYMYRRGITYTDYEAMYATQNGNCLICGEWQPLLHIDHDHKTGVIRGLLCRGCNYGLGNFRDSCSNLQKAIDYLT